MITIIYETKYQSTDNATQQCGVILSRMVKHGNAVGGWGRWARCYYSNGFSKHPVNRRLPSTLAKDKRQKRANLVTSVCLPGILSGKKYAKAFCLYAVSEISKDYLSRHMWNKLLNNPLSKLQNLDH